MQYKKIGFIASEKPEAKNALRAATMLASGEEYIRVFLEDGLTLLPLVWHSNLYPPEQESVPYMFLQRFE